LTLPAPKSGLSCDTRLPQALDALSLIDVSALALALVSDLNKGLSVEEAARPRAWPAGHWTRSSSPPWWC
jgi:hypothetical protein